MDVIINLLDKYGPLFTKSAITTLLLSLLTIVFALIFGSILSLMKLSKFRILRYISNIYVEFIRGTPLLVQIYLVFYGLPLIGIQLPPVEVFGMDFERLISGIIALTINSSAYVCEIVRGGIQSVDKGQMEAARSLGFGRTRSMLLVVMPQAIKIILPSLANEFVSLIKNSSQVSVIGIAELMYTADTIRGITFKPFEPFIIISVIYFVMTFIISLLIKLLEKKLKKSSRD